MPSYLPALFLGFVMLASAGASAETCADLAAAGKTLSIHMKETRNGKATLDYVQKRLPVKGDEVVYLLSGEKVTEERTAIDGLFDRQVNIIVKESGKKSPWITYSYDIDTKDLLKKIEKEPVVVTRIAHGAFGSEQKFTARLVKTEQMKMPLKRNGKDLGACSVDIEVIEFAYHDDQHLIVRYRYAPKLKMVLGKEENYIKIYMGSLSGGKKKKDTPSSSVRLADYIIEE